MPRTALMLVILLAACSTSAPSSPTPIPSPTVNPSPTVVPTATPDPKVAWLTAMCPSMHVLVDEIGGAWGDVSTAIGAQNHAVLAAANLRMAAAADRMRPLLDGLPEYAPGDEAKLAMIRVVNASVDVVGQMTKAGTWFEVNAYAAQVNANLDQLKEFTARMDALGFGRGKYC
jgi:hypothetical protein